MHKSVATIQSPEFINLKPIDINPLMSSCEIKVMYIGENRNHSYITKEVATEMSKTLRGAPIVGYYKKDKEDFADHGQTVIIDDEGVKFECKTRPYGFVDPNAKVWFQTFEDTDEFGNTENREYLMTTGYLWTGQYKECQPAVTEGRPHSMELDEETLDGHWATNRNSGMDFFIINDAIFSKLCILGDDVEPCFEGSSVTAPKVSASFTKMDDEFKKTLFTMMQELQVALQGGQQMEDEVKVVEPVDNTENSTEYTEQTPAPVEGEEVSAPVAENTDFAASKKDDEKKDEQSDSDEGKEEPKKEEEDEEKKKEYSKKVDEEDDDKKDPDENSDAPKDDNQKSADDEDEEEKKKKYALLETEYAALQEKYSALEVEYNKLVAFKAEIEDAKKDEMIAKFAFLSDEDKKDVIENKSKYTVDEIEAKLCVICVRNKVNFSLDDIVKNDIITEEPTVTFSLENEGSSTPAWIKAVQNNRKN